MEENNQLERFFRKRIQNYKPESKQWEEDLNDVWENALPHISKSKTSNYKLWYWCLGAVLVVSLAYYFVHQKWQLADLKETVIATKDSMQELQEEFKKIEQQNEQKDLEIKDMNSLIKELKVRESSNSKNEAKNSSYQLSNSKQLRSTKLIDSESTATLRRTSDKLSESAQDSGSSLTLREFPSTELVEGGTHGSKSNLLTSLEENFLKDKAKKRNIDLLDTLAFSPIVALNIKNFKVTESIKLPDEKLKKITWAKLKTAPVLINRKLKNFNGPGDPFERRDFSGLQLGLDLGWDIYKRFSIQSGFSYFQFSSKNTHTKSLIFSSDEEQMTPLGLLRTSKSFILRTPIGLSSGNYIFTREPTDFIADGTNINTTFNSQATIQYLQIPFILNYKIKEGRFQIYAKAGLIGDIVMRKNFEVKEVFTDNLAFSFNRSNTNQPKNLQNFTLNYLVGLGLEYRLNKQWSISLDPTYTRGITPQAKPFGEIEVSLETVSLGAGMKYHF